jgi:hypothetical protein
MDTREGGAFAGEDGGMGCVCVLERKRGGRGMSDDMCYVGDIGSSQAGC